MKISISNMQEFMGNLLPKKRKTKKISIEEARKILIEEEINQMIDIDEIKEIALRRAENMGIIFIDEIDKIISTENRRGDASISREGVQRDLLPIVEGSIVNTKYGAISTEHILFISAGAFHSAKPSDLIPEFQGRFPLRVELKSLSKEDFFEILKTPKNALTKQYSILLTSEEVELTFDEKAIKEIASIAYLLNQEIEDIGARRLHTVMSCLLNRFLFDIPDKIGRNAKIYITQEMVKKELDPLIENRDLNHYIL